MNLPFHKQVLFNEIVLALEKIDHVAAIVLGGSFATGRATEDSDIDIGLYYHEELPFEVSQVEEVVLKFAVDGKPVVTDFYAWGPWVNGGAWIQTESGQIDLLYRNIEQVETTIQRAEEGLWDNHYEQQPPYGFSSVIYLAETAACIPIFDPQGLMEGLKAGVQQYPQKLKETILKESLWAADFTLRNTEGFARKDDYFGTFGCLARMLKNLTNALFALNETYFMGDKGSVEILAGFMLCPENLEFKIERILTADRSDLRQNLKHAQELFDEVAALTDGFYTPLYNFKK